MTRETPTPSRARRFDPGAACGPAGLVVIIAGLGLTLSLASHGFLSPFNLFAIGRALAVDIMIGFAQMASLATGGMNLSIGSIGVCAALCGGYLMQTLAVPVPLAIVGALALGAGLGGLNGVAITRTGVNSFVITLASANLYSGAMLIQPTIGVDWLLLSFAAPIIGGASLSGGHISVVGAMLAVLLIGLIENGMVLAKVDPYWVRFLLGALILAAVGLNRWRAVSSRAVP